MRLLTRTISLALTLLLAINASAQLSDKEMESLKSKVRADLEMDEIGDGARVYQTSKHWVLVSFATISSNFKPALQNRQAQVVASRNAIEFLEGARNRSTTVYDAYTSDVNAVSTRQGTRVEQDIQEIASETSSNVSENSQTVEKETMSEKIVQESIKRIDGLQPLLKYKGAEGTVFAYFMIISKQSAKKKR